MAPQHQQSISRSIPLCYMLPNSNLITTLAYIDQEIPEYKNKIQYLIKQQMEAMLVQSQLSKQQFQRKYLDGVRDVEGRVVGMEGFEKEVENVRNGIEDRKKDKKQKQKSIYQQLSTLTPQKPPKQTESLCQSLQKACTSYQQNMIKQINLELLQKLGPIVQKQYINALDKKKQLLIKQIQQEKCAIERINQNRQYMHLEARERETTVRDRVKVMVYKRRKLD